MSSDIKRIAVLTSGGDAPGMNAAVRAVVRTASSLDLHVYGIRRGYEGMIEGDIHRMEKRDVGNIIHRGGTILKTARSERFKTAEGRKAAYESLLAHDIDAVVVIGGNGTFTGALKFEKEFDIPMVGVPGTIDNDLFGTDYTIGFDTSVNTAVEAMDRIRDTADSHNRLFFVEVMGRNSGFIALNTAIGSGAESVLIPEVDTSIDHLVDLLHKSAKRNKLFSLVVVAEGHKAGGAAAIAEKVRPQLEMFDIKVTIIGHLQRGGAPSSSDRVLASRLGHSAVLALMDGKKNLMVGIKNHNISFTPFAKAIKNEKLINEGLLRMAETLAI
ncbi:MAG: 6-phosphofructokinase [Bacteroidetes bacterium]|nr:6-phosphofructokinase [Bacteroidota bacterium]